MLFFPAERRNLPVNVDTESIAYIDSRVRRGVGFESVVIGLWVQNLIHREADLDQPGLARNARLLRGVISSGSVRSYRVGHSDVIEMTDLDPDPRPFFPCLGL